MKRFALLCILAGCIGTAWAQDTIYVKGNTWCPKEKATGYVIVTREMPLYKVDTYTLEGRLKETTYYIRYTEQPNRRMKEGTSTTFYENGNVEEEIVYTGNSPQSLKVFYPDGKIRRENRLFVSWMFFNRGMVPAPEMPLKKGDRERECRIPEMSETAYMLHPAWLSAVFPFLSSVFPDSAPFRCGKFRLFLASGTE